MRYVLVPVEATHHMVDAGQMLLPDDCPTADAVWIMMLSAAPEPTDAEIDDMCRAMWGDRWYWDRDEDAAPTHRQSWMLRAADRARMRSFLTSLRSKPKERED